ncbi:MAG: hypothetical protein K0R55_1736 [Sporomusa sp.]|jgi:hypothetical protein|nr:hypothetical protein [Sporomusa sp.]
MNTFYEVVNSINTTWNILYSRWLREELFSPSWLVIIGTMAVSYVVLFLLIDKSRIREIIFYGSLLAVSFGYIDVVGTNTGLWAYKTHFLPFSPSLFPFTYTVHPIVHLLVYQYAHSWQSFAIWNTIASGFFAFIAHPFYVWTNVIWFGKWNYMYSFILGLVDTFFIRAIVIWLANIEQKHSTQTSRAALFPALQPAMKQLNKDDEEK